ncbi:DNA methyltransferase [Shewanella sp. GXUN23E]|uniref:DNA methyltransferase n=1 Tax=Shewanella sp. GXUN23E TaxID=3422498 RepID=UPI003D7E38E5
MQQDALFTESQIPQKSDGPVTCLGKIFANDTERRAYFTQLLAEKLKDPEFRKIEGFPIGTDEAILNLSDPPYYTACPNPWIADFIAQWEAEKPAQAEGEQYHREPFAADVSEGKNDPIYNAHSYHTKVPHKAIMRYILHYTNPGDIVFDGFCGTGMTGVAAQMCGDRDAVLSLGYQVKADGSILRESTDENGSIFWSDFSVLGARKVLLNDLSPAATFIAQNYTAGINVSEFKREAFTLLQEVESELGWMYETKDVEQGIIGRINYVVWSDVFSCSNCQNEVVFHDAALDEKGILSSNSFHCPKCNTQLSKSGAEKVFEQSMSVDGKYLRRIKKVPVKINFGTGKMRGEKTFSEDDRLLHLRIEQQVLPNGVPLREMGKFKEQYKRDALHLRGIETASDFYTRRNLIALGALWERASLSSKYSSPLKYWLTSIQWLSSNMYRHRTGGGGGQQGKLTIPSLVREQNVFRLAADKLVDIVNLFDSKGLHSGGSLISTSDAAISLSSCENAIDYIFIDPPFGGNIFYSDLNSIWEGWHSVITNDSTEAVVHRVQTQESKGLTSYGGFMRQALISAYRALKPGRWVTIEFSNSQASVWNVIQTSLQDAGFVVANVAALDKKQRSFRSVTSPTAVKQDLVISAYKPNGGFEQRFETEAGNENGVWDFIRTHLQYLPVVKLQGNSLLQIPERDSRILFDQLVAYYVRKGYQLPVSSQEFQLGLAQRFIERDGMFFLDEQAAEYDKKKAVVGELVQASLFVKDEASAIQWLRQLLKQKPQVFSDINPLFMQQLSGWSKKEVQLDLRELLNQNFLCFDGLDDVPVQIHSYLSTNWKELRNLPKTAPELKAKAKDRWYVPDPNSAGDLEKLRERSLLKEFEEYKTAKKKLKVLRIEAARVGFKKLFEAQEFASILDVAAKLPADVIAEDPVLLMYYDQAMMLTQTDSSEDW